MRLAGAHCQQAGYTECIQVNLCNRIYKQTNNKQWNGPTKIKLIKFTRLTWPPVPPPLASTCPKNSQILISPHKTHAFLYDEILADRFDGHFLSRSINPFSNIEASNSESGHGNHVYFINFLILVVPFHRLLLACLQIRSHLLAMYSVYPARWQRHPHAAIVA